MYVESFISYNIYTRTPIWQPFILPADFIINELTILKT